MKKKIITSILTMVLFALQVMPVYAAGEGATLSSGRAAVGENVTITITVNEAVRANAVGISFITSDEIELENVDWDMAGGSDIRDLDKSVNRAFWTFYDAKNISGKIATITYRVKAGATAGNKNINATVTYIDGETLKRTDILSSRITVIVNSGIEGAVKLPEISAGAKANISLIQGGNDTPVASAVNVDFVAGEDGGYEAAYRFDNIPSGSYLLRVSATGCISKDIRVNIGGDILSQDVELTRLGDANGDGIINSEDLTIVAKHIARVAMIEDDYTLKAIDVDSNGEVNSADITEMAKLVG